MYRKDNEGMDLLSYIKGDRKGRDAHELEREAMLDPFLADALDGYDNVSDTELDIRLERMKKAVQTSEPSKSSRRRRSYAFWLSAAAVLLFACTLSFEFGILSGEKHNTLIAMNDMEPITVNMPETAVMDSPDHILEQSGYDPADRAEYEHTEQAGSGHISRNAAETAAGSSSRPVAMSRKEPAAFNESKQAEQNISMPQDHISTGQTVHEAAVRTKSAQLVCNDMIREDVLETAGEEIQEIAEEEQADGAAFEDLHIAGAGQLHKAAACKMHSRNEAICSDACNMSPHPVTGYKAYYEYIYEKLELPSGKPDSDSLNDIVVLSFNIDENGQPGDFMIVECTSNQVAERIIEIIKDGGKWTGPGPVSSFTVVY